MSRSRPRCPRPRIFARSSRSWSRSAERRPACPPPGAGPDRDADQVTKLFDVIGPRYADRPGGYTRVLKAGFRHGDNAPMAIIEFVDRDVDAKGKDSGPAQDEVGSGVSRVLNSDFKSGASAPLFYCSERQTTRHREICRRPTRSGASRMPAARSRRVLVLTKSPFGQRRHNTKIHLSGNTTLAGSPRRCRSSKMRIDSFLR